MTGAFTHDFEIGTAMNAMVNLQALTVPVRYPKTAYHPYAGVVDLDDNSQRGVGLPSVTWHWNTISQDERDQLRTYCTGDSASVYIRTRTNDNSGEFLYYQALMIWPSLEEEYDAVHRREFSIVFRMLTFQPDPSPPS
jgi:hypothetical protein